MPGSAGVGTSVAGVDPFTGIHFSFLSFLFFF